MSITQERPQLATLNEIIGSKQGTCDFGGAWIVYAPAGHVTCVTSNRQAAEDAVYGKAAEDNLDPKHFRIEVWHMYERWLEDDADTDRVTFTLPRNLGEILNRHLIAHMIWLDANHDPVGNETQELRQIWETLCRALGHLGLSTDQLLSRVQAGTLSRSRAAEELNISEWEFLETYGDQIGD